MQNPRAMPAFVSVPHRYWRHVARAKPAPLIILWWWAGRIGNALSREERVRSYIKDKHGSVWCALALMMWPCSSYPLFMISSTSLPHPFPRLQSAHQLSSKRRREKVVRCLCWRQRVRRQNLDWARAHTHLQTTKERQSGRFGLHPDCEHCLLSHCVPPFTLIPRPCKQMLLRRRRDAKAAVRRR